MCWWAGPYAACGVMAGEASASLPAALPLSPPSGAVDGALWPSGAGAAAAAAASLLAFSCSYSLSCVPRLQAQSEGRGDEA